ncbi:helix-turn-helix domain-containing protein [Helcococcus kunzii]|uniref:helix-turn-helix domain-containing protein n=1 Tax=Helcococcus kunzii TaxID=40091 RepID=UPI0038ACC65F
MNPLKKARIEKGYTLEEVAEYLNVTKTAYFYYEKGERAIPDDKVDLLIKLLDLDADIFLPSRYTISEQKN